MNNILSIHTNMVIDPRDREKQFLRPSGLGITIPCPLVNNHVDIDPSGIIPIIFDKKFLTLIVDHTVPIDIRFSYHLVYLVVCQLLSEICHHVSEDKQ